MSKKEDRRIKAEITIIIFAITLIPVLLGWKILIINLLLVIGVVFAWWKSAETSIEQSKTVLLWGTLIIAAAIAIEIAATINEFMDNLPTFFQPKQYR